MKITSKASLIAFVACLAPAVAASTTLERGRAGLDEIPLSFANAGTEAMSCGATLAHWYSQPIGTAAPSGVVTGTLWLQRDTGTVFLLNEIEDRMPVERLWCGKDGASWSTRSEIPLERIKGKVVAPIRMACAPGPDRLDCRPG
ncbi:hypothetical protein [Rhizobium sp. ZW T2_16]|uniref:hypothetical protein n=1 Tax=Rhizobium sp. ZW T2_16 TaxID=3378083 RepID=UPI000FAE61A2